MRIHRGRPTGWRVALASTLLPLSASVFSSERAQPGPAATDLASEDAPAVRAGAEPAFDAVDPSAVARLLGPETAAAVAALQLSADGEGDGAGAEPAAEVTSTAPPEGTPPLERAESAPPPRPERLELLVGRMQPYPTPWPIAGASITDPAVADFEVLTEELLMVTGRMAGETDVLIWNGAGETVALPIEVRLDTERLAADLRGLFPDSTLAVSQSRGITVLGGTLARAEQAAQLARFMEVSGIEYVDTTSVAGVQQVQVQVRVAEVSRNGLRALGVNGFSTSDNWFGGLAVGSAGGGALNPVNIGPAAGSSIDPLAVTFNDDVSLTPAVTLFAGSQNAGFQSFIQALRENQYLRMLAEPNLVALSGETASFLAGGEFPIPVVQGSTGGGGSAVTIEYKEFGVGLKFRPVVLGDGSIRLTVSSEVSELSDIGAVEIEGFRVPSVVTRRAETTLEMRSGQTFAMAGLISENTSAISSSVPGLGRLPVLGALFRSVRYRRGESELLLLVSASLVEPTSDQVLPPLPGSTHLEPSDWELFAGGRMEAGVPPRISADDRAWLAERGLDRLRGPGAWSVHGEAPARMRGRRRRPQPAVRPDGGIDVPAAEAPEGPDAVGMPESAVPTSAATGAGASGSTSGARRHDRTLPGTVD